MKRGAVFSLLLHLFILILVLFGLPSLLSKKPPEEEIVSVELLPVQSVTNVRPQVAKQEEKKEEEKPEPPKEPVQEEKKPEPTKPEPKKEEEKPEPVKPKETLKKPEEKKPEPKPEPKKKEKPQEDFDSVLKNVEKMKPKPEDFSQIEKAFAEDAVKTKKGSRNYDPSKPMSASEIDAIKNQITKCWNLSFCTKDAKNILIKIHITLDEEGALSSVPSANTDNPDHKACADSAIRAVEQCSPFKNLPKEKYSTWKDIDFAFTPSDMQ